MESALVYTLFAILFRLIFLSLKLVVGLVLLQSFPKNLF